MLSSCCGSERKEAAYLGESAPINYAACTHKECYVAVRIAGTAVTAQCAEVGRPCPGNVFTLSLGSVLLPSEAKMSFLILLTRERAELKGLACPGQWWGRLQ